MTPWTGCCRIRWCQFATSGVMVTLELFLSHLELRHFFPSRSVIAVTQAQISTLEERIKYKGMCSICGEKFVVSVFIFRATQHREYLYTHLFATICFV
jgi:hypothetical protein